MASNRLFFAVGFFVALLVSSLAATRILNGFPYRAPFKVNKPFIIAHRGANVEFPESSAPAFKRAIEEGADFIETDIGATKDGHLICLHDATLDAITDVANRTEFKDRLRTYEVEGSPMTGYFSVDFTLEEIKSLRMHQRYDYREQRYNGMYQIATFDEYLAIALNADRVVGVDPEIKNPVFINKHVKWEGGKLFEDKFVETLQKYGYRGIYLSKEWLEKPVIIQTFAPMSIWYIVNKTDSPKVFNIGPIPEVIAQGTNMTYGQLSTDEYLDYFAPYLLGISVQKTDIAPLDNDRRLLPPTDLIDKAHARGLQIHPATYKNEDESISHDFHTDPYFEFDYVVRKLGVDALLIDNTATLKAYLTVYQAGIADRTWGH